MNFLQKKIREVKELIINKIDICLIPETKLDQPFPNQQFQIHGYTIFQRDRKKYVGGIPLNGNENFSSQVLHLNSTPDDN